MLAGSDQLRWYPSWFPDQYLNTCHSVENTERSIIRKLECCPSGVKTDKDVWQSVNYVGHNRLSGHELQQELHRVGAFVDREGMQICLEKLVEDQAKKNSPGRYNVVP